MLIVYTCMKTATKARRMVLIVFILCLFIREVAANPNRFLGAIRLSWNRPQFRISKTNETRIWFDQQVDDRWQIELRTKLSSVVAQDDNYDQEYLWIGRFY